jgi:uncharacterized protein (TIRG00374 family)
VNALSRSRRPRHRLVWTAKIVISAGLLWLLLARVDLARLWETARGASMPWLAAALALYFAMVLVSAWRWGLLLAAQHVRVPFGTLTGSFLVATFFNNFLPSNIGGDVVRVSDTARAAGSKTLAATVVLVDRGIGLLGLVFIAALGATLASGDARALGPLGPGLLWTVLAAGLGVSAPMVLLPRAVGRALRPLQRLHHDWVSTRIERLTSALGRFGAAPGALAGCFAGAIVVQALIVAFYAAAAHALSVPIPVAHLAVLVPLSFIVQMLPISVNGFGVREATFGVYFARIDLPLDAALALSFTGAVLMMILSIPGAAVYLLRANRRRPDRASTPETSS